MTGASRTLGVGPDGATPLNLKLSAASLRTALGVKAGAKVSLSVSCAVGAQRATTTQSVTLGT